MKKSRIKTSNQRSLAKKKEQAFARLKALALAMMVDIKALGLARRDQETPWCAKIMAAATIAYALSPIDLIPDFIPVIGYVDDLIIIPIGIWLTVRLMPSALMARLRSEAARLSR